MDSGIGIAHGPRWLFDAGLKSGNLVMVLSDYVPAPAPAPAPIQILYVANRLLPKRTIAFMDFITHAFSGFPALNVRQAERLQ